MATGGNSRVLIDSGFLRQNEYRVSESKYPQPARRVNVRTLIFADIMIGGTIQLQLALCARSSLCEVVRSLFEMLLLSFGLSSLLDDGAETLHRCSAFPSCLCVGTEDRQISLLGTDLHFNRDTSAAIFTPRQPLG